MTKQKQIVWGLLFAIIIAAFALRFTNVGTLPSGLFPDEAENGMDALSANATGQYKLFYEANNGREGLFINIQALSVKFLDNNITALRLPSVVFGTLTVLGVFLLTYELLQSYIAGLIGAYLIAFSYWAINFSRIGFRAIMVPFILTFAFYFVFRGLRTKKIHDFVIAGLIYGLGLHTYIAFRVSPLVFIALFASLLVTREHFFKKYWKHVLVFAVAMFVASAPMLLDFFVWHPEHYASRTSEISILNPAVNQGHLFTTFLKTFSLSLAKYNFWGDQNWRQNYPPYPILNPLTGIAFLLGLVYIFSKFFHLVYVRFKNGVRSQRLDVYVFLLAWFFALLIPEFLAAEGNPHALRSIGTLPVVMIIAVIPFMWIINRYHNYGHSFKIFIVSILAFTFLFIGISDPIKYFVFFANNPKQSEAFDENLTDTAYYMNNLPPATKKYVISDNEYILRPIKFLSARTANVSYVWADYIKYMDPQNNNFAILLPEQKDDLYQQIKNQFPGLKVYRHEKNDNGLFIEFKP
jgi:4-amino-4-deoxy-L-arabinose transferase-like glycosyltransferase